MFVRVIGLPSEEDWPKDSPISYSVSWGPKGSCTKLLHSLGPDENDLLSVSRSVFLLFNDISHQITRLRVYNHAIETSVWPDSVAPVCAPHVSPYILVTEVSIGLFKR